jgi:enoyl-CoA hydratase
MSVLTEIEDRVLVVTIDRPQARNAVDAEVAAGLLDAFRHFDRDPDLAVAVLTGAGGHFCAGADLKALSGGRGVSIPPPDEAAGPLGPTRLRMGKPVVAAVEGYAVAGGLELALWCDLRVVARDAVLGVYCRRFGVPLADGGTIRLPRLIGMSHALDMILTGRGVGGEEAYRMGLANRLVEPGTARAAAVALAAELAQFPPSCLRSDRLSAYEQEGLPLASALANEARRGIAVVATGETADGAARFVVGRQLRR